MTFPVVAFLFEHKMSKPQIIRVNEQRCEKSEGPSGAEQHRCITVHVGGGRQRADNVRNQGAFL